jgi:hypothetical protein
MSITPPEATTTESALPPLAPPAIAPPFAGLESFKFSDIPSWTLALPQSQRPGLEDVLLGFQYWSIDQMAKILEIYPQKGGWEGWAQVELALGFTQYYADLNTEREVQVYVGNKRRADLVFTSKSDPRGEIKQIIELKVETSYGDAASAGSFVTNLTTDLDKITDNGVRPEYLPALVIATGCTFVKAVNEYALNPANWGKYAPYIRTRKLLPTPVDSSPIGLFNWYMVSQKTTTGLIEWAPREKPLSDIEKGI